MITDSEKKSYTLEDSLYVGGSREIQEIINAYSSNGIVNYKESW